MTDTEMIVVLQRLEQQTKMAIELVRSGRLLHDPSLPSYSPNTFTVADFTVDFSQARKFICPSCTPKSNEP